MAEKNIITAHGIDTEIIVRKSLEVYDHAEGGKVVMVSSGGTGTMFHLSVKEAEYLADMLTRPNTEGV